MSIDTADPSPTDGVLLARQPVFDRRDRIAGFELSFAPGTEPAGPAAAARMITTAFGDLGLRRMVGDHRAYINATPELLAQAPALRLPPDRVVLQLAGRTVDEALLATVRGLVDDGFGVGVGGWALSSDAAPLLELASVVKVDFEFGTLDLARLVTRRAELQARGITLIATDVQTRGEYDECRRLGFDGFRAAISPSPLGSPANAPPHSASPPWPRC